LPDKKCNAFAAAFEGDSLDASLLLMHDVGFLAADDPRFASTVAAFSTSTPASNGAISSRPKAWSA
jgi:GH15 family glucan-1,4-alpha-glucosidase